MNVSNSDKPPIGVTAWRLAILALGGVVIMTGATIGTIYARGLPPVPPHRLSASSDWSIQAGVLEDGMLSLQPAINSIGLALHPLNSLTYTLQLRLQILTPTLAAGVVYAAQDAGHFSAFLINPDGYFTLSDYDGGAWHVREPWRTWPHIRRADQPNRLRVECAARGCAFYVNDESTWQIANQPAASAIGVAAYSLPPAPSGIARFEQIELWP